MDQTGMRRTLASPGSCTSDPTAGDFPAIDSQASRQVERATTVIQRSGFSLRRELQNACTTALSLGDHFQVPGSRVVSPPKALN